MQGKSFDALASTEKDIVAEVGNIGFGNAMTSLSSMLNAKLSIDFTHVYEMEFDDVMSMLGGPENLAVAVLCMFEGDIDGMLFFIMEKSRADNMVNVLLNSQDEIAEYSHIQASAMKEIGNIIGSSYMAAVESMTGLQLRLLPPQICVDMAGAILSVPVIEFGQIGDKAFLVESKFGDDQSDIGGHLLMVSNADSYGKMCDILMPKE